ncbi:MAG TPA: hypothetical protein VLL52_03185 [Anaerolineae bacterium]|nr:hypothetical protein [Anaerolineae bacterium]
MYNIIFVPISSHLPNSPTPTLSLAPTVTATPHTQPDDVIHISTHGSSISRSKTSLNLQLKQGVAGGRGRVPVCTYVGKSAGSFAVWPVTTYEDVQYFCIRP